MKRKVLALLLALIMMLSLSVPVFAADTIASGSCGSLTWTIDSNYVLTVSGRGEIKETGGSLPWDAYSDVITSVVLSEGVTGVCAYGFSNYDALKTVTLPSTLTYMGEHAFENCPYLKSVVIPGSLKTIPSYAFRNCTNLSAVTIQYGVVTIGRYAFEGCSDLTEVVFPNGLTGIGDYCFANCEVLSAITVPAGMVSLGNHAFDGCDKLKTVNYGGTLSDWVALDANGELSAANVVCATAMTGSCGDRATYTFHNGTLLLQSAGDGHVGYENGKPIYKSASDTPWYPIRNYIKSIVIDKGVTLIGDYAFAGCSNVTDVSVSKNLVRVCKYAFSGCKNLKLVSLTSVQIIEDYAFKDCAKLRAVALPAVWDLYENVFNGCTSLESVFFGKTLRSVGKGCFKNTEELDKVYYTGTETNWKAIVKVMADNDYLAVASMNYSAEHGWIKLENVAPTCTANGLSGGVGCYVCGKIQIAQTVVESTGHNWVLDKTLLEATCDDAGKELYSCTACDATKTKTIKALGHKWKKHSVVSELTETTPGIVRYQCENCLGFYDECTPVISRVSGKNRSLTAIAAADAMKKELDVSKFDTIILASGTNFADALAGSYLSAVESAPILLYTEGSDAENQAYIKSNLADGGKVYLLGGETAVPAAVEKKLTDAGIDVERLSGKNRYETNLAILKEAGVTAEQEILVATGNQFADSLSASATGLPILLVNSNSNELTANQKKFLSELAGTDSLKLTIVGGTGAVSDQLAGRLAAYGTVERVSGSNRYKTSVAIAERYFEDVDSVVIAYGKNFPDGLSGGALAYAMGAPLILVAADSESAANAYADEVGVLHASIMGGTGVISDSTVKKVFG